MRNWNIIILCAHLGLLVCTECSTLVTAAAASPNVLLAITHRGKNVATRRQEGGKSFLCEQPQTGGGGGTQLLFFSARSRLCHPTSHTIPNYTITIPIDYSRGVVLTRGGGRKGGPRGPGTPSFFGTTTIVFLSNTQSRFAQVFLDGDLGPPRLTRNT